MSYLQGFSLVSRFFLATITAEPLSEIICMIFSSSALIKESQWTCEYSEQAI